MFELNRIIRKNILELEPYSSARSEYKGSGGVFLDANEGAFQPSSGKNNYNRYPDPLQSSLKTAVSELKGISPGTVFIGNGSDEAIDLLIRTVCEPGRDEVIICPPTYGMYETAAALNNVGVTRVPLLAEDFQLDVPSVIGAFSERTKLLFLCNPNNPTGNAMPEEDILLLLEEFKGIVVLDEAYVDFGTKSFLPRLRQFPNLVVLQTLSKAWGLAGLRIGMAFGSEELIGILNKVKPPYNVNSFSQLAAEEALKQKDDFLEGINKNREERKKLAAFLENLPFVRKVYPSETNFLMVRFKDSLAVHTFLKEKNVIVRDRNKMPLCGSCLRISIGTSEENKILMQVLNDFEKTNANEKSIVY